MSDLFDYADEEKDVTELDASGGVGAPECGLLIALPKTGDHDRQCFQLGQALHAANRFSSYSINRHIVLFDPNGDPEVSNDVRRAAQDYCTLTQRGGFVFLLLDDVQLAREIGADGVLCSSLKKCSDARKTLEEDRIIGLRASNRAAAQSALSLELDFVSFHAAPHGEPLMDLLNWWGTATDTPSAIEGNFDQENCAAFIAGGATFIDASEQIWNHPSGNPMQGVVNMLDAIERHSRTIPAAH